MSALGFTARKPYEAVRTLAVGCLMFGLLVECLGTSVRAQQRIGQLPTLPLTQFDDRLPAADLDKRRVTVSFPQPVPIQEVLLMLVRDTSLSMALDPTVAGSFVGELKKVTVRHALGLILPPLGLDYTVDGGLVRVFRREPEARLFDINLIATGRTAVATVGTDVGTGSIATVSSATATDAFADLTKGIQALVSASATFNLDRKAGLLQVVDYPDRLDRVAMYLDAVHDRINRQVRIDVRVIEVELSDVNTPAIDWPALSQAGPAALSRPPDRSLTGLRVADVTGFLAALEKQGKVKTIADPRIVVLNNEPATVRGLSQLPSSDGDRAAIDAASVDGLTLSVTPQIGADGIVMLSLTPRLAWRSDDVGGKAGARVIQEAATLARVADGETIVFAGFPHERLVRERKSAGTQGGWFGRKNVVTKRRTELLILLTPRILNSSAD